MKHLSLLLKPASSLCNMRCRYCFYHDLAERRRTASHGLMSAETAARLLDNVRRDLDEGDELTLAFQGGEPTLAGLSWFEAFAARAEATMPSVRLHWALQTNGLLLDTAWAAFLRKYDFLTGLSLDGAAGLHDRNRPDLSGGPTFARVLAAKRLLEAAGARYNVLSVLTRELAAQPDKVWRFLLRENIRHVQFIPCVADRGSPPCALGPPRFASFYTRLFPLWRTELERGNYISVKFFDDTANWFFRGQRSACGIDGHCAIQYVVEADGSVYPCDFYALDQWRLGSLTGATLRQLFDTERARAFLTRPREQSPLCRTCPYAARCGGGCPRLRESMYTGEGARCGYRTFLDACLGPLREVTVRLK